MKISYDAEVDALSITFRETTVTTKHLGDGIAADYDGDGRLTGLEILDAQKRFGGRDTMREVVLEGLDSAASQMALHDKPVGTDTHGCEAPKSRKEEQG
jgi:uncharacterized protein YuzE